MGRVSTKRRVMIGSRVDLGKGTFDTRARRLNRLQTSRGPDVHACGILRFHLREHLPPLAGIENLLVGDRHSDIPLHNRGKSNRLMFPLWPRGLLPMVSVPHLLVQRSFGYSISPPPVLPRLDHHRFKMELEDHSMSRYDIKSRQ